MIYKTAQLIEVFSAIQGEGLNAGTRQIFIRFAFCDLRCHFCDSAHTWLAPATCRIEQTPGQRDFATHDNPVKLDSLLAWVMQQDQPGLHDSISITGGEPLLHTPFLVDFLPQLRKSTGLPVYLETGGHRPSQLATILTYLDSVGMDIKLPNTSGENCWQAHGEFLKLCYQGGVEVFVKIAIASITKTDELLQAASLVALVSPEIPVFLQPITPLTLVEIDRWQAPPPALLPPSPEQVLEWQALMKRQLKQVRVLPQTHKMLGQL